MSKVAPSESDVLSKDKMALMRASENLRRRIEETKDFEILNHSKGRLEESERTAFDSWMWSFEYDEALELEKELLKKYKGKNLSKALPGKIITNEQGSCYGISSRHILEFKKADYDESRQLIISDLKLIPGIGLVRENALKRQGYMTIEDLECHRLWAKPAKAFMGNIKARDVKSTQDWLWQRLPKSHPLVHYLAGFCKDEDLAIIDIETLGLSERPIVLLGIAKLGEKKLRMNQFLLRDIQDEPSAITALISQLEPNASLITFNGRAFDIPYIKQRLAYYGMDAPLDNPHFDVLHFTRRAFRSKLPDCRLDTVEKHLGIRREMNIPGAMVPHFYETYLRTQNVGPVVAIVEHNKQDLITLSKIFSRLYEEWDI
jgi:hypothetical protein